VDEVFVSVLLLKSHSGKNHAIGFYVKDYREITQFPEINSNLVESEYNGDKIVIRCRGFCWCGNEALGVFFMYRDVGKRWLSQRY
jgi:hypothetical protein